MEINKLGRRSVIICVLCCIVLAVGIIIIRPAVADYLNQSEGVAPFYPVNENGQTYGCGSLANSPEEEPDLILAEGIDGTRGYVLAKDLDDGVNTPEEAVAYTKEHAGKSWLIPLYASDGTTVIGQFRVGGN